MTTDLNKLREFLPPTTVEDVRRAGAEEENALDEPGFVHALEAEMRVEFLACAQAVARGST
ncbi:MAG: hypothetical protein Q8L67_05180 [Hydrogenophaga sp.]|nr:hypothetical protein [Hydrogenophaga sp.]